MIVHQNWSLKISNDEIASSSINNTLDFVLSIELNAVIKI